VFLEAGVHIETGPHKRHRFLVADMMIGRATTADSTSTSWKRLPSALPCRC
jgi:hypothetical protein